MYQLFSSISHFFSEPFIQLFYSSKEIPILAAFLLGVVGAMAPCQITGNISAITYYGNRTFHVRNHWGEALLFILGKIVVFSSLGLIVWLAGQSIQEYLTGYFSVFRKLTGPLIILIGLFLLNILKLPFLNRIAEWFPIRYKSGYLGSFLMGASFAIAFCPTMFVLFFFTLMPIVLGSTYGFILPSVFAVGTSLPLILFLLFIFYFDIGKKAMKDGRRVGRFIQMVAGVILIIIGVFDTVTYWS